MARYRHRPSETTAEQFREHIAQKLAPPGVFYDDDRRPYVITIHGAKTFIADGDYIVQEPDGVHYYPCKPDIFEAHYEAIDGPLPQMVAQQRERLANDLRVEWEVYPVTVPASQRIAVSKSELADLREARGILDWLERNRHLFGIMTKLRGAGTQLRVQLRELMKREQ